MRWLSDNYKWLFDGLGATLLVTLLALWLSRLLKSSQQSAGQETDGSLKAADSKVTNSPVASGSEITQTVNAPTVNVTIGQQMPAPAPPVLPILERPRSDIQPTAGRVVRVAQVSYGVWSEDRYGQEPS